MMRALELPDGPGALPVPSAALIVLDGWGLAPEGPGNAVALARTPVFDELWAKYPHTTLIACGPAVGLPEGQMGNSEVGHLNLGAGAVVVQDLTRIDSAVTNGALAENPVLRQAFTAAERVHVIGLASDGGVHSGSTHLRALIDLAAALDVPDLVLHAFTDGRDTPPDAGAGFLGTVEEWMSSAGIGRVGSVVGRYFAMDRDRRWDRTQLAYDMLVHGEAEHHAETGRAGSMARTAAMKATSSYAPCWSARRRGFVPAIPCSRSTSAPTGCARSPARSPSPVSTRSTAAARSRSSATPR